MRYEDLIEAPARPWKKYRGWRHPVALVPTEPADDLERNAVECAAFFGDIETGKQAVFHGYFVSIVLPTGDEIVGEHPSSIRAALREVSKLATQRGWKVLAIGQTPEFRETGLSANSGFGFHPAYPDRHVHMLEPASADFRKT